MKPGTNASMGPPVRSDPGDGTAVIIPVRNERESLPDVLRDLLSVLPGCDIIVVDDFSGDGTGAAAAAFPGVSVLRAPIPLGVGGAVQLGVRYGLARGAERFVRMDGDGQHRAGCVSELLGCLSPGALVQGSRARADFAASSNRLRHLGSRYFQALFRLFTGRIVSDPTSGLMCFGSDIARKIGRSYPSDYPEVESLALLLRAGHPVISREVPMASRRAGESSIGAVRALVYMFSVSVAFLASFLRRNPYGETHGN